ncbi:MAG: hypothetical protein HYU99_10415 [Deltaproteobacteria bacterium]|nr:hypothetical protein [Deltaproteobacteria bacterium]
MKKLQCFLFLVFFSALPAGCGLFSEEVAGEIVTDPSEEQPTLSDGDFPDAFPCLERNVLPTDDAFLQALTDATEVLHVHKEYVNDDNIPAVCGLAEEDNSLDADQTGWDPLEGADIYACNSMEEELTSFPASANYYPGMCRAAFGFESGGSEDGFPRAGTYRVDFCLAGNSTNYQVRLRIEISGEDINNTWAAVGEELEIDDFGLENLEVFGEDGNQITSTADLKSAFVGDPRGFVFTIRSSDESETPVLTTHLEVGVQIVCITTTSACPTPDESC